MQRRVSWLMAVALVVGVLAAHPHPPPQPVAHHVPLVDYVALAAHADSDSVSRGAIYGLAWMESRTGRCLPNCPRGPGQIATDSLGRKHRVCREVGRMQINPCAHLEKLNPRCAFTRVLHNLDDNYACGVWYYSYLRQKMPTLVAAFAAYNGGSLDYAKSALAKIGEWWLLGFLTPEDRRAR